MNQLIWFSIPGAIFMAAWAFVGMPTGLDSQLIIALTLPIGFAIHQFFRTLFERIYGWELPSRKVISKLKKRYGIETRRKAFVVWEMTLYSNKIENNTAEIPEPFRKHNRDSWHYVISFWSCAFISAVCALGVYVFACIFDCKLDLMPPFSFGMIVMALFFAIKGHLTYIAINEQEVAALRVYKEAFDKIADKLGYRPVEMHETHISEEKE